MFEPKGKGFVFDDAKSDPLEHGRRSRGGEGAKHSSRLGEDVFSKLSRSQPAPNLNGCCSCCLNETVLVEKFLVRVRDGRRRMDFLRLRRVSECSSCSKGIARVLSSRAWARNVQPVDGQLWLLAGRKHVVVVVAAHDLWRRRRQGYVAVEGSFVRQRRDVHRVRHKARRGIWDGRRGHAFPSDGRGCYAFCCLSRG